MAGTAISKTISASLVRQLLHPRRDPTVMPEEGASDGYAPEQTASFFYPPLAWIAFETLAVPSLFRDGRREPRIRAWVPSCGTGAPAYSLAFLLNSYAATARVQAAFQVIATDEDADAIEHAREAWYPLSTAADFSPAGLEQYFIATDDDTYRVRETIRQKLLFAVRPPHEDPPHTGLDVVLFHPSSPLPDLQALQQLGEVFHRALQPGGYLFCPDAAVPGFSDRFEVIDEMHGLLQRPAEETSVPLFRARTRVPALPEAAPVAAPDPNVVHARLLATHYAPPSVLIDDAGRILHRQGETAPYICRDAAADALLPDAVHADLKHPLRELLQRVRERRTPARSRLLTLALEHDFRSLTLALYPVPVQDHEPPRFLVAFESGRSPGGRAPAPLSREESAVLNRYLHNELSRTKEQLNATIQRYEASNEELLLLNETLLALSAEHREKREALETHYRDLNELHAALQQNYETIEAEHTPAGSLLAATHIGFVLLDEALCLRFFTLAAQSVFSITNRDLGRPLAELEHRFGHDVVLADAEQVRSTGSPIERILRTKDDRWFIVHLKPCRIANDRPDGVLCAFTDTTERKRAEEWLHFKAGVLGQIRDAVVATNASGRITYLNDAARTLYGRTGYNMLGRPLHELYTERNPDPGRVKNIEAELESVGVWRGPAAHTTPDGRPLDVEMTLNRLRDEDGRTVGWLAVIRDVTYRI